MKTERLDFLQKSTRFLLAVSLCLVLISETSYSSIDRYLPEREYINITLPAQTGSAPVLLSRGKDTILVRAAQVNGKRYIQVLICSKDGAWLPLGDRGNALTGNNGASLVDAKVDSDGKLWVLAYTAGSNKLLGGHYLIYSYENDRWVLENHNDKQQGEFLNWDSGLHFLGKSTLCHIFCDTRSGFQFKRLIQGQRQSVPIEAVIKKLVGSKSNFSQVHNINNASWLLWTSHQGKTTQLKAIKVSDPKTTDISSPYILGSWNHKVTLVKSTVSAQGEIAVCLFDYSNSREYIKQYIKNAQGKYIGKDLPFPRKSADIAQLKYSPDGKLYAASILSDQEIFLDRYMGHKWKPVKSFKQGKSDGQIFAPAIYFIDNKVIVVWENFWLSCCG